MKGFALLLTLFTANAVWAKPTITSNIEYYDIYPTVLTNLGKAMRDKTPNIKGKKSFIGLTNWNVKWRFKWQTRNGKCEMTSANTSLDIKYTMPRIAAEHQVSARVRKAFNNYFQVLMKHELQHGMSGVYAAREIEQGLFKIQSESDCKTLEQAANAFGHQIIKKYNQRDKTYDKQTNHGRTEGVDINNFI